MSLLKNVWKNKKILWLAAVIVVVVCVGVFIYWRRIDKRTHSFWVAFLNIGQGDSALIHFENGEKMLVDCGPDRTVLSELGKQLPFWDRTIDVVLATHPDRDHYGGCIDVLKRYTVKKVVTNGRSKPYDAEWAEWDRLAHAEGAELVTMASPTVWQVASSTLEFLSPDPSLGLRAAADDSNNYSIVFRLIHGDKKYLFTGDMEILLEEALIKKYCVEHSECQALQADVLKVGHHGSPGSTGESLLQAVGPTTAVISVGKNKYGHPSGRVIKKLERAGASVLRTDSLGAIVIE